MLNREKYAKEILDIICNGDNIAVINGEPISCNRTKCVECVFSGNFGCLKGFKEWANSEYVETPVDWSKVAVDTPILVKDFELDIWKKRYFAGYKDGRIDAWGNGTTSWSANGCKTTWNYAKLAESEESHD